MNKRSQRLLLSLHLEMPFFKTAISGSIHFLCLPKEKNQKSVFFGQVFFHLEQKTKKEAKFSQGFKNY